MPSRRSALSLLAGAGAALALSTPAAQARPARPRPFGRYGSPGRRLDPLTLYVDPHGRGDHTDVRAALAAATGTGHTLVIAPGTYRGTLSVSASRTGLTLIGASGDPRDTVIVYDNAAGTPKPDGSGTLGTSGSATVTVQAADFTARDLTFANDWLRSDNPGYTGTQAVAIKVQGDRSAFHGCRFLGHQDTLYADSLSLTSFARQYYRDCYMEGDVDFVFGRATAVYDRCHFRTLTRTDLAAAPYGFVFAPSTAGPNPHGYLVLRSRVTSTAPDGYYKLARPWVPSSDPTAHPMLTVRDSHLGAGIDAAAPYGTMSAGFPWQEQRFAEYRNTGPGARTTVPGNRPQLSRSEARAHTPAAYLGDWCPYA
ncbi:pectin esterase [Streptomyces nitrosporeus]|uniref:Pectin esterase n=1 Tax=Streptomyces nitrosporeus TaxID=28894 RepID=A0A5J6FF15_9ACTN|nr:pectinesterase family protein [Streptomyces nitrosporeus]QEU75119.1 pectin esterase [Streptomyces nitrosporeus]GGY90717.1 pectinesterase [Streptomyces nitrosporeus]